MESGNISVNEMGSRHAGRDGTASAIPRRYCGATMGTASSEK